MSWLVPAAITLVLAVGGMALAIWVDKPTGGMYMDPAPGIVIVAAVAGIVLTWIVWVLTVLVA